MFNALDRVQLISGSPPCQPGKCIICGYSGGDAARKFLDLGLEIDFYGVVYFCTTCILGNLLTVLDMVPQEEMDEVKESLRLSEFRYTKLETENAELRSTFESLTKLRIINSGDDSVHVLDVEQDSTEASKTTISTNKGSTGRKTRPTKQVDESGSTDVLDPPKPEFDL